MLEVDEGSCKEEKEDIFWILYSIGNEVAWKGKAGRIVNKDDRLRHGPARSRTKRIYVTALNHRSHAIRPCSQRLSRSSHASYQDIESMTDGHGHLPNMYHWSFFLLNFWFLLLSYIKHNSYVKEVHIIH